MRIFRPQEGRTEKDKSIYNAKAYSAASATSPLASATIPRRDSTELDVQLEILFCGICHSDLHQVRNEWRDVMPTVYPCVPGHEIVGRVTRVGSAVTWYKAGDLVAIGCMVDSDRTASTLAPASITAAPHTSSAAATSRAARTMLVERNSNFYASSRD